MTKVYRIISLLCFTIVFVSNSFSAPPAGDMVTRSFSGRNAVSMSLGLLSDMNASSEISRAGVTTRSGGGGFMGALGFTHWYTDRLGVDVNIGVMNAEAKTSVGPHGPRVESAVVMPLLFGIRYQPVLLTTANEPRVYLTAAVGPYFGMASNVTTDWFPATEEYTETALGARIGVGMSFSLGRIFIVDVGAGYHLVSDFPRRIGSRENYSSPDFTLALSFVFGGMY